MPNLERLEFHRSGIGLAPPPDEGGGQAIFISALPDTERPLYSCTCSNGELQACPHLEELDGQVRLVEERLGGRSWDEYFVRTIWYRVFALCADESPLQWSRVRVREVEAGSGNGSGGELAVLDDRGRELARWMDPSDTGRQRLLERLGKVPPDRPFTDRAALLSRLARFQLTPQERHLEKRGAKSSRQAREESVWFRLAYHCARELPEDAELRAREELSGRREGVGTADAGVADPTSRRRNATRGHSEAPAADAEPSPQALSFRAAVDRRSGSFLLTCLRRDRPVLRLAVPHGVVKSVLKALGSEVRVDEEESLQPIPLRTLFHVGPGTEIVDGGRDVRAVRTAIVMMKRQGERRYLDGEDARRFRWDRLQWVPELEVLTELEVPGKERRFRTPPRLRLSRSRVPAVEDGSVEEGPEEAHALGEPPRDLDVLRGFDRLEIRAERVTGEAPGPAAVSAEPPEDEDLEEAEGRSWYWLSVHYGAGEARVSLTDLLRARKEGLPYIEVPDGWIDLASADVEAVEAVFEGRDPNGPLGHPAAGERFQLGLSDLLRLQASAGERLPLRIDAEGDARAALDRLVQLRPADPYRPPRALASALREYQVLGTDWLRFLAENGLGGLLCDDMGLGKTHQAMALMASLVEQDGVEGPFLVVAPTTVLPHWKAKLRDHAPGLGAALHHGPHRNLGESLRQGPILLTSYGILRNDVEELSRIPFALAIFDEIQHLKNRDTVSYRSASALGARVKVGMTGTPIENSLSELKALFDLVLPGYLGSDARFQERYGSGEETPGEEDADRAARLDELRRVVSPFILRRTKEAVLDELPEKIEDLRLCSLSDDQVALYREAIQGRGADLAGRIREGQGPVPYIHVFALLNLLKRICDHPALALDDLGRVDEYSSGKWDLFRELLEESLDSGQKVVVFSQYLGMVDLIATHLEQRGTAYVTLTGSSRDRGALVERFNEDPDCRVFVGSLKAGGTGIDLVGGSVVIHYDRWWNSAREEQATDRVHRMGQRRAVQVFKLVTEGTLEEKIHAIIERKRRLADSVIQEDDPRLSKLFTREELLDLLRPV